MAELNQRNIGLRSLNDPIDTTTAQGRLVFNIFASLAEFEREIIRERTNAGCNYSLPPLKNWRTSYSLVDK